MQSCCAHRSALQRLGGQTHLQMQWWVGLQRLHGSHASKRRVSQAWASYARSTQQQLLVQFQQAGNASQGMMPMHPGATHSLPTTALLCCTLLAGTMCSRWHTNGSWSSSCGIARSSGTSSLTGTGAAAAARPTAQQQQRQAAAARVLLAAAAAGMVTRQSSGSRCRGASHSSSSSCRVSRRTAPDLTACRCAEQALAF